MYTLHFTYFNLVELWTRRGIIEQKSRVKTCVHFNRAKYAQFNLEKGLTLRKTV